MITKLSPEEETHKIHISTRRRFTSEEDSIIKKAFEEDGIKNWNIIAERVPDRTAKQCRDRYVNYLKGNIFNDKWTTNEDNLLREKVKQIGKKWKEITEFFPGRGTNNIKNRWHKVISHEPWAVEMERKCRICTENAYRLLTQTALKTDNNKDTLYTNEKEIQDKGKVSIATNGFQSESKKFDDLFEIDEEIVWLTG